MIKLVLKNIRHYSFRYLFTFIILFLVNIFLYSSDMLIQSAEAGLANAKNKIGADLIVSEKVDGFEELAERVMFDGVPKTLKIDSSYKKKLMDVAGVTELTSRLYLATLDGQSCCDDSIQLIATDLSTDFLLGSWTESKVLAGGEIILGSKIRVEVGETVQYFGREFKVKEILPKTGTGYDVSGFIALESARDIMQDERYQPVFKDMKDSDASILFINSENPTVTKNIIESVYGRELSVYSVDARFSNYINTVSGVKTVVSIMKVLLLVTNMLAVFVITAVTTQRRKNEFGTLMLIGHDKKHVSTVFVLEQLFIFVGATVAAVLVYTLFSFFMTDMLEITIGYPLVNNFSQMLLNTAEILILNIVMAAASVGLSIYALAKESPANLIKEST